MSSVLVLNVTYEPLSVVSLRRAIVLLLKDKAEILEAAEERIRAAHLNMPMPLVIRLVYFVRVPHKVSIPLSRRTVMMRDRFTCQYCGTQPPRSALTIDHVLPKVRGGATTWENVVCACKPCNLRKGCRTPEEANMRLHCKPARPQFMALVLLGQAPVHDVWAKYMPGCDSDSLPEAAT